MAQDKGTSAEAAHHESRPASKDQIVIDDKNLTLADQFTSLSSDELRDQMTAQVKASKLRWTSAASFQLYFFLFVAYCSKYHSRSTRSELS